MKSPDTVLAMFNDLLLSTNHDQLRYSLRWHTHPDQIRNALAPQAPRRCMPTGLTLAQGRKYTPSYATDVRKTWAEFSPLNPS